MAILTYAQEKWCDEHYAEAVELLRTLGRIPAPSHFEHMRAEFVRDWLKAQGAKNVYLDEALNVIYPIGADGGVPVAVLMAHTDIVFPDMEPLEMREEGGCIYAPGIGDDTANLVALMMAAKYIAENRPAPKIGMLVVANSCEEGLGNLKGSKQIMSDFDGRVREMISIDGGTDSVVNKAVGSCRMRVTVRAQGGHSYGDFGNTNAIVQMAQLISRLYEKEPPKKARTTYNVGVIEGGTTVNSICGECSMLYEYRSEDRECLFEMDGYFKKTVEEMRAGGMDISVEVLGVRPCSGDVDPAKLNELTARMQGLIGEITGKDVDSGAGSTDANSALALGIPAVTIGAINGGGAHTRGEWVETGSLRQGLKIALATLVQYFD